MPYQRVAYGARPCRKWRISSGGPVRDLIAGSSRHRESAVCFDAASGLPPFGATVALEVGLGMGDLAELLGISPGHAKDNSVLVRCVGAAVKKDWRPPGTGCSAVMPLSELPIAWCWNMVL